MSGIDIFKDKGFWMILDSEINETLTSCGYLNNTMKPEPIAFEEEEICGRKVF